MMTPKTDTPIPEQIPDALRRAVVEARDLGAMPDPGASFVHLLDRVHAEDRSAASRQTSAHSTRWGIRSVGIGAALVLLIGVGGYAIFGSSPLAPSIERTVTTRAGERAKVTLADGSTIIIAPETKLQVESGFGRGTRTVHLLGEARFTVARSAGAPFIVRTASTSTRVLGTVFSVRQYAPSDIAQIVVQAGKVVTGGRGTPVAVVAGQFARVADSTAVVSETPVQYTDWERGQLVFDHTPVPELLTTVGRWYGYRFVVADSVLTAQKVSVVLNASDPSDMILQLKAVLDVTMTFHGTAVTLTPRGAAHAIPRTIKQPLTEMGR